MKFETFHDTPVPYMYACVPLKPVLVGNHSLLFLQVLAQWQWYLVGFKKNMVVTEFRGTFCFAKKWTQWVKNSRVFWKRKYLAFSWNNHWNNKMKHCRLYFTGNPLPVESLVLTLCFKILLANQIAGFFKMQYLKKKVRTKMTFCM